MLRDPLRSTLWYEPLFCRGCARYLAVKPAPLEFMNLHVAQMQTEHMALPARATYASLIALHVTIGLRTHVLERHIFSILRHTWILRKPLQKCLSRAQAPGGPHDVKIQRGTTCAA